MADTQNLVALGAAAAVGGGSGGGGAEGGHVDGREIGGEAAVGLRLSFCVLCC